jgi:hypothetical protein
MCCHPSGKLLVRFYGDHSSSWVAAKQLVAWDEGMEDELPTKTAALTQWGKKNNKWVSAVVDIISVRAHMLVGK